MTRTPFQERYIKADASQLGENPLFKDQRKRNKRLKTLIVAIVPLLLASMGVAYAFSSFTRIDAIEIDGLTTIAPSEMKESLNNWMNRGVLNARSHRPFLRTRSVERHLLASYDLETVESRVNSGTLFVKGKERASELLLQESADQLHLVDLAGVKTVTLTRAEFDSNPAIAQPGAPVFIFYDAPLFATETTYLSNINIEQVLKLHEYLKERGYEPIQYFIENNQAEWFEVKLKNGPLVKFDGGLDAFQAVSHLSTVVESLDPARIASMEYIDLRFGNTTFVK